MTNAYQAVTALRHMLSFVLSDLNSEVDYETQLMILQVLSNTEAFEVQDESLLV